MIPDGAGAGGVDLRIVLGVAALVVSLIALFRERLVNVWFGPVLELHFSHLRGADLHLTTATYTDTKSERILAQLPCWYLRVRVRNRGRSTAEKVELSVVEVHKRDLAGRYVRDDRFLPLNLTWSHTGETFRERIAPGSTRFCDLLHVTKVDGRYVPEAAVQLDLEVHPAGYVSKLRLDRSYRLVIEVAASNVRASTFEVDLHFPSPWCDDATQLTRAGFYMTGLTEGPR